MSEHAMTAGALTGSDLIRMLSRGLFDDLKSHLIPDRGGPARAERLLDDTCREVVERIAAGETATADPSRLLFMQVRSLFPAPRQVEVYGLIARRLNPGARALVDARRRAGGSLLRCAAVNRKGRPCGREPLRGSRYCPSHRHLEPAARAS